MSIVARYMEAAASGYPLFAWTVTVLYYDYGSFDSVRAWFGGMQYEEGLQQPAFSADGTKAISVRSYQSGVTGGSRSFFSFTLSVPFSRSNVVLESTMYEDWTQSRAAKTRGNGNAWSPLLAVNDDGTKLYVVEMFDRPSFPWLADYVLLQYDMNPAWDVSTATQTSSERLNLYPYDAFPKGIRFNSTGTKLYIHMNNGSGNGPDSFMTSYTLSTPWVIKTGSKDMSPNMPTFNAAHRGFSPSFYGFADSINWKPDGTRFYIGAKYGSSFSTTLMLYEFRCSTAWDQSTAQYHGRGSIGSNATQPTGEQYPWFKPDGTRLYVVDEWGTIWQFSITTAWDITTIDVNNAQTFGYYNTNIYFPGGRETSIQFKPDGTKMFVGGYRSSTNPASDPRSFRSNTFREYTLSPAWNITSATFQNQTNTMGTSFTKGRLHMSPDGLYYLYRYGDELRSRRCYTAWSLGSFGSSYNDDDWWLDAAQTSRVGFITDFSYEPDASNRIKKFKLLSGNDVITFVNNTVSGYVGPIPNGVTFPLPTAGFNQLDPTLTLSSQNVERGLDFSSDGLSLYTVRNDSQTEKLGGLKVAQYTLGSAYDYMDVTSVQESDTLNYITGQRGTHFGSRLYSSGLKVATWDSDNSIFLTNDDGTLNKFDFGTPGDVTTLQQLVTPNTGFYSFKAYFQSINTETSFPMVQGNGKWQKDGELIIVADYRSLSSSPFVNAYLHVFEASTAYNVSTLAHSYTTTLDLYEYDRDLQRTYTFNDDGTKFYICYWRGGSSSYPPSITQFELSTPWNLESRDSGTRIALPYTGSYDEAPWSMQFLNDGEYLFVCSGETLLQRYTLTTPYDISTAGSHVYGTFPSAGYGTYSSLVIDKIGKRFMVVAANSYYDYVVQGYRFNTAMDPSAGFSIIEPEKDLINSLDPYPTSRVDRAPYRTDTMDVRFDGKKMYILGKNQGAIYQYGLS